ncbi:MAG: type II secretion system F family protein [Planctomycetota bacterium]
MAIFTYQALDSQGKEVRNEIEAESSDDALNKLRSMDLFPTSVKEKAAKRAAPAAGAQKAVSKHKKSLAFGGVKRKDLAGFTRQLSTLINAGLPIVRSLKILTEQAKAGVLKNALYDVGDDVEGGMSLSEALAKHPKAFNKLYVNMVKAGEAGGILDQILERLATFMEKAERLKKQVISAMIYPAVVILVAGTILMVIMIFIVPKFKAMFSDMDLQLPTITKILLAVGDFVKTKWYVLPGVPIGVVIFYKIIASTKSGRYGIDFIKLKLPVFGIISTKSTLSSFTRTLGTLITSGVPILEALNIVKDATPNAVVSTAIGKVHDSIREGESMAAPLAASKVCDPMIINMIDVGEETGELDKMLLKVADQYDEDVDALVSGMMSLIEPLLIVGMGLAVGFIVVSLFLPLITLMTEMGG